MAAFRCEGLCKSFDGIVALQEVHAKIPSKGITAIIGPNGAGKTTLFNILTGFVQPDRGRCFLDGYDITGLASHQIAGKGVARTFQDLRLIFRLSVLENLLLARPTQLGESFWGALLRTGVAAEEARGRKVAMALLEFVGLQEKAEVPAEELSYGQQKLLTLACCLATEARILLLDEPVAGVHLDTAAQILESLRQLAVEKGKVIVFIEHDMAAVSKIANHVILMDEGKIIANGPAGEILNRSELMEAYFG